MISQKLIILLIKSHYFTKTYKFINKNILFYKKNLNSLNKTDEFAKMINSLSKTDDFTKTHKFS